MGIQENNSVSDESLENFFLRRGISVDIIDDNKIEKNAITNTAISNGGTDYIAESAIIDDTKIRKTILSIPPKINQTIAGDKSIEINIKNVNTDESVEIERDGLIIGITNPGSSFLDNVGDDLTHVYRLRYIDGEFTSNWSNEFSDKAYIKATTPSNVWASYDLFSNKIEVSWNEANNANGYSIKRDGVVITTNTNLTYIEDDIFDNAEHTYEIMSIGNIPEANSDWSAPITGRAFTSKTVKLKSAGYDDSNLAKYVKVNDISISGIGGRGWSIVVFPNSLEQHSFAQRYDTYGSPSNVTALINKLQSLNAGDLVAFITYDEPATNIVGNTSFYNEMIKFGADTTILDGMEHRSSYLLLAHKYGKKYAESYGPRHNTSNNYFEGVVDDNPAFFGKMSNENWSNYNKSTISTTQLIQTSYGYENLKNATYTTTVISSDADWDKHPRAKAHFHETGDMYYGQILVGNRLVFEMGNDHTDSPGGEWDKVGKIVEVNNGTQHYYIQKVYGNYPFNNGGDSDDNGVWEVVDITTTNRGGNTSTTNYYLLN